MPRTEITTQPATGDGTVVTADAGIADGHMFKNDGNSIVRVKNASVGPLDVTFVSTLTNAGLDLEDRVVSLAAGEERFVGPFPRNVFNQRVGADAGKVYVNYPAGSEADIEIAVIPLGA